MICGACKCGHLRGRLKAAVRDLSFSLLVFGVGGLCLADDASGYFALQGTSKDWLPLSSAGDLRLCAQNPLQLRFLEKRGLILVRVKKAGESDDLFLEQGGSVKDAVLSALARSKVDIMKLPAGGFRIGLYPTAMISVYCDIAAFQSRPYPSSGEALALARLEAMMRMPLKAGDVIVITLLGVD